MHLSHSKNAHQGKVMAIGAHPDDIEFMMAGTLLALVSAGWEAHYMSLADGCCGSLNTDGPQTAALRKEEAKAAAKILGATWHPSLTRDLEVFYDDGLIRRLASVIRQVAPSILLTHYPSDYMEDHINTCRLAVTASFVRGMPNYATDPPSRHKDFPMAIYHAMPHGLIDQFGQEVRGTVYVNVNDFMERKRDALRAHASQQSWLDVSQGMSSYIQGMEDVTRRMGHQSCQFQWAEGWKPHAHLGFSHPDYHPLEKALESRTAL